jgi:hypothetical protein
MAKARVKQEVAEIFYSLKYLNAEEAPTDRTKQRSQLKSFDKIFYKNGTLQKNGVLEKTGILFYAPEDEALVKEAEILFDLYERDYKQRIQFSSAQEQQDFVAYVLAGLKNTHHVTFGNFNKEMYFSDDHSSISLVIDKYADNSVLEYSPDLQRLVDAGKVFAEVSEKSQMEKQKAIITSASLPSRKQPIFLLSSPKVCSTNLKYSPAIITLTPAMWC